MPTNRPLRGAGVPALARSLMATSRAGTVGHPFRSNALRRYPSSPRMPFRIGRRRPQSAIPDGHQLLILGDHPPLRNIGDRRQLHKVIHDRAPPCLERRLPMPGEEGIGFGQRPISLVVVAAGTDAAERQFVDSAPGAPHRFGLVRAVIRASQAQISMNRMADEPRHALGCRRPSSSEQCESPEGLASSRRPSLPPVDARACHRSGVTLTPHPSGVLVMIESPSRSYGHPA